MKSFDDSEQIEGRNVLQSISLRKFQACILSNNNHTLISKLYSIIGMSSYYKCFKQYVSFKWLKLWIKVLLYVLSQAILIKSPYLSHDNYLYIYQTHFQYEICIYEGRRDLYTTKVKVIHPQNKAFHRQNFSLAIIHAFSPRAQKYLTILQLLETLFHTIQQLY